MPQKALLPPSLLEIFLLEKSRGEGGKEPVRTIINHIFLRWWGAGKRKEENERSKGKGFFYLDAAWDLPNIRKINYIFVHRRVKGNKMSIRW